MRIYKYEKWSNIMYKINQKYVAKIWKDSCNLDQSKGKNHAIDRSQFNQFCKK